MFGGISRQTKNAFSASSLPAGRQGRLCGENSILDKHDIHGNLPALEATVADATSPGDSKIVRAGDRIAYGPFPSEVCRREALAAERAAEGFLREDKVRFLH